jgi:hypothetical protein
MEHAWQIIFFRPAEGSESVNGANEGAWSAQKHSTIARDVPHVQSELADEPRAFRLMPEDVSHRRARSGSGTMEK